MYLNLLTKLNWKYFLLYLKSSNWLFFGCNWVYSNYTWFAIYISKFNWNFFLCRKKIFSNHCSYFYMTWPIMCAVRKLRRIDSRALSCHFLFHHVLIFLMARLCIKYLLLLPLGTIAYPISIGFLYFSKFCGKVGLRISIFCTEILVRKF